MKLAVATYQERVSPRFDAAPSALLIDIGDGEVGGREVAALEGLTRGQRVARLTAAGAEALICGGVDRQSAQLLNESGMQVYGWVSGTVDDAIACYLRDELEPYVMLGQGGRCCGRWRFRHGPGRGDSGGGQGGRGRGMGGGGQGGNRR